MDELTPQVAETPPTGTPVPSGDSAPSPAPAAVADGDGSLSAHEAAHGPAVEDAPETDTERDARGKFKPRRRATSQQADADDVPAINELTKRLKTAEDAAGKDIVRKPGESERVFTLRRRAELAERLAQPPTPPKPAQAAPPPPSRPAQPLAQTFPSYEAFLTIPGYESATYEDYTDARADWRYAVRREQERQQEAAEKAQRDFMERATGHLSRVQTARTKYADFDTVVNAPDLPPITFVLRDAILASKQSEDVQYFLGQHRDVLAELIADSQDYSPSAVSAMRRYLDTLVAQQRPSLPPRVAAGPTGAALALAPSPAPKPPTPVRTGAVTSADDPPGDDSQSLAAHEKFFGRARR